MAAFIMPMARVTNSFGQLIGTNEHGRIWFAEGKGKASALVPAIPMQAVIVLRHKVGPGERIVHQAEVYAQTDSKAATLVLKLLGSGARPTRRGRDRADAILVRGPSEVFAQQS